MQRRCEEGPLMSSERRDPDREPDREATLVEHSSSGIRSCGNARFTSVHRVMLGVAIRVDAADLIEQ